MSLGDIEQRMAGMKKQAKGLVAGLIAQACSIGYQAGYEEGKGQAWSEEVKKYEIEPDKKNEYIEQGRNEAWETVIKILEKPWPERRKALERSECRALSDMFSSISASEAMEKLRAYEEQKKQEKEEIKVGDEVTLVGDSNTKGIVINAETTHPKIFLGNCTTTCHIGDLILTGRHFPELGEYLKKMQEDIE